MTPDAAAHVFYERDIPADLELKLVELYQNPFCSMEYFRLQEADGDLNALAIYGQDSEPAQVLVYRICGTKASLLNAYLEIEQQCLQQFASLLFERHPQVNRIEVSRARSLSEKPAFPYQLWTTTNDVVIDLPGSLEEYDENLGKNTRKNVKYYLNRLRRENADFSFEVTPAKEITPALISRIIDMNRSRMQSKHIRSGYDSAYEMMMHSLCERFGLACTIKVDNEVIAGVICYRTGSHCFGEVLSHDIRYNNARAGQVCFYLTLQHLIKMGTRFYHMMEGENDYKYRFLGKNHPLSSITIYRSGSHKLRDLPRLVAFQYGELTKKGHYWANKYLINKLR